MDIRNIVVTLAFAAGMAGATLVTQASAQDSIYVPLPTYRTGRSPDPACRSPTA